MFGLAIVKGLAVYLQVTDCKLVFRKGPATEVLMDLVYYRFCDFYLICALIIVIKNTLVNSIRYLLRFIVIYMLYCVGKFCRLHLFLEGNQSYKKAKWLKR